MLVIVGVIFFQREILLKLLKIKTYLVLKQALGTKEKLEIQKIDFQLNEGDVVFLCTDGLYNEFGEEYFKKRLQEGVSANTLVGEALLQKPKDNVSAIVINVV